MSKLFQKHYYQKIFNKLHLGSFETIHKKQDTVAEKKFTCISEIGKGVIHYRLITKKRKVWKTANNYRVSLEKKRFQKTCLYWNLLSDSIPVSYTHLPKKEIKN